MIQSPVGSLLLSSRSSCPPRLESLFPPVLWKSCNQIPLAFQARFHEDSQLGSQTWGSEPSKQWESFFGIIVLQFVGHPRGGCGIRFYCDCTPPGVSLQLLLCLWTWSIFLFDGLQCPPVNGYPTTSCDFGALTGGDKCTYFYSDILNWNLLIQHPVSVKRLFCFCLLILVLTQQYNKLEICELIINCILLNFLCKVFA